MRRDLKPSLRQDTSRKKTRPTDIVKEIVIDVGDDTVLHYEGSPLMNGNLVADPENESLHSGIGTNSYDNLPWLAIGLATDNVEDANNDVVTVPNTEPDHVDPGSPLDGSGGIHQPPSDIDGMDSAGSSSKFPTRTAILLDLAGIPNNAIIESAELELTAFPNNPPDPGSDVFGSEDGVSTSVWPSGGVEVEVMNLIEDVDPSCTWNTKNNVTEDSPSGVGDIPASDQRWWRQPEGVVPPNAIGIAQNTRRSDTGEPLESIKDQLVDSGTDGGEAFGEEYYGHIGYGISGGGCVVNTNDANSYPSFNISFDDWGGSGTGLFDVDVTNLVQYSLDNQNKKCNLLLRAKNWTENDAAANPDAQRTYPENVATIEELEFDRAYITSPLASSGELDDLDSDGVSDEPIENDQILHAVPVGLANENSVTYTWQIEVPVVYESLNNLTFNFPASAVEGNTVEVTNVTYLGGDGTETTSYEWFLDGTQDSTQTSSSYTIPDATGGSVVAVKVTVSNTTEGDSIDGTENCDIAADSSGSFNLTKIPDTLSILEGTDVSVQMDTISGVGQPSFGVEWKKDFTVLKTESVTPNSSGVAISTITAPLVSGGAPLLKYSVRMFDGAVAIGAAVTGQWGINDTPAVPRPAILNGSYKLDNVSVCPNYRSSDPSHPTYNENADNDTSDGGSRQITLDWYEEPILAGCDLTILDEPSLSQTHEGTVYDFGVPFGYWRTDGNVQKLTDTTTDPSGLTKYDDIGDGFIISLLSGGDGNFVKLRSSTSNSADLGNGFGSSQIVHMITRNGANGRSVEPTGGQTERWGDCAVWLPGFSNVDDNGWIIMTPVSKVSKSYNGSPPDPHDNKKYRTHDREEVDDETTVGWKIKTGPSNADDAKDFWQSMPPMDSLDRTDSNEFRDAGPINSNDENSKNIHINFYTRDIPETVDASSTGNDWDSVIATAVPSTGGGPSSDVIPLITAFVENSKHALTFIPNGPPASGSGNELLQQALSNLTVTSLHGSLALGDKNNDEAFALIFGKYIVLRVEPTANVDTDDDGVIDIVQGDTLSYYTHYMGLDTYDNSNNTGPEFAWFSYKKLDGSNWSLIGYRTGNQITNPSGSGDAIYLEHMYFNAGTGLGGPGEEYVQPDVQHVLYVFDTRAEFETAIPSNQRDINAWDATNGVEFP